MSWHVFTHDAPMRTYRCVPPAPGAARSPEDCPGCGIEVTEEQLLSTWQGEAPPPLNASLNMVVRLEVTA